MLEENKKKVTSFDTFPQVNPNKLYFDEILTKLMEKTTFFHGLAKEIVFQSLQKIREVPTGVVLIEENSRGCDFFYLLLKGRLGVYEGDIKIAEISGTQIFWEIGFFNGKRIATVQTEEKSYVAKITREFIEGLDPKVQAVFFQNIASELSTKISTSNGMYSTMLKNAEKKATDTAKNGIDVLTNHIHNDITQYL